MSTAARLSSSTTWVEDFAGLAAATAMAAVEASAAGPARAETFAPLLDWLAGADPATPPRRLTDGFDLAPDEVGLVALLFAAATSEPVARAVAGAVAAGGGSGGGGLPMWLACRAVPGLAADALCASRPLMRLDLVTIDRAEPRIEARLALAAPIVDRLLGGQGHDPGVLAHVTPLRLNAPVMAADDPLVGALGEALVRRGEDGLPPLVLAPGTRAMEVARALHALGLGAWHLTAADVPEDPHARDRLARRWSRDAALDAAALVIDATDHLAAGASLAGMADRILGHVVVTGASAPTGLVRDVHLIAPPGDDPGAARRRWATALGARRASKLGPGLGRVAAQFRLDDAGIATAVARASPAIDGATTAADAEAHLWHAASRSVPPEPVPGVMILEPAYHWDDLVLAPSTAAALRRIEAHVRHASVVMDDWGFAARMGGRGSWRGRGVAVLFAGPSGTGKTMAAEVLADALDLRVMAIDLSQVISKYVGETSKNIAAAFEQAERSGAVMVWNEGDAVWGVRGGVGNATDRHVNAEVGDLLQRIEAFSGFTVVTTNLRHAIDPAFLRRFRFIVDFPLPSEVERRSLWARAFPPETPLEPLEWDAVAHLPLTGGSIRNVSLGAAFLAAEAGEPVGAAMIEAELADELRKHDLPVTRLCWDRSA